MKKIRYIPYGYTMRNGHVVIEHSEADVIRHIFTEYVKGASLNDLAEELTLKRVPYTEKTDVWDRARVSRIIDNAKYAGLDGYDPIVAEQIYDMAVKVKAAKGMNQSSQDCDAVALIRDRVRCGCCGSPMTRHICSKRKVRESWNCVGCNFKVRVSDTDLLIRINLLLNRIIDNTDLIIPAVQRRIHDTPAIQKLQREVDLELNQEHPSEAYITEKLCEIASQLYQQSNAKEQIVARIAQKRASLMKPQSVFNSEYFTDLIDNVILEADGSISLVTKTQTRISEGATDHGR